MEYLLVGFEPQMKLVNWKGSEGYSFDVILEKIEVKPMCLPEDSHHMLGFVIHVPEETYHIMGDFVPTPIEENSLLQNAKNLLKDTKERLIEKRNRINPKYNPQTPEPKPIEIPDFVAPNPIVPPNFIQKIYPNPFVDYLKIEIHVVQDETLEFVLYDVNGRAVFSQKNTVLTGTNLIEMDFGHLNLMEGNYFLSIFQKGGIVKTEMVLKTNVVRP